MKLKTSKAFLFLTLLPVISGCTEIKNGGNTKDVSIATKKINAWAMLLPINGMVRPRISLAVEIPLNFCSHLPVEEMLNSTMNEFFPKADKDINSWSEIITTNRYAGQRFAAKDVANFIRNGIERDAREIKLIDTQEKTFANYSTSEFTMAYTYQGKREVIFAKYFSGPYDCSGYQYTIRLLGNLSETGALNKIKEFNQNQVLVIDVSPEE